MIGSRRCPSNRPKLDDDRSRLDTAPPRRHAPLGAIGIDLQVRLHSQRWTRLDFSGRSTGSWRDHLGRAPRPEGMPAVRTAEPGRETGANQEGWDATTGGQACQGGGPRLCPRCGGGPRPAAESDIRSAATAPPSSGQRISQRGIFLRRLAQRDRAGRGACGNAGRDQLRRPIVVSA